MSPPRLLLLAYGAGLWFGGFILVDTHPLSGLVLGGLGVLVILASVWSQK